jgi:hypothetical protein
LKQRQHFNQVPKVCYLDEKTEVQNLVRLALQVMNIVRDNTKTDGGNDDDVNDDGLPEQLVAVQVALETQVLCNTQSLVFSTINSLVHLFNMKNIQH